MKRSSTLALPSCVLLLGLSSLAGNALAQQKTLKEQLVGSWTFVSSENVAPDGTRRQPFGPNPKGTLILDASGRFAQMLVNPNRPKFKGTRLEGTPEENKAVVQATVALFGTWSVDEANRALVMHIEIALWPNEDGTDSIRPVTLVGDELKFINPAVSAGGRSEVMFRRAK